MGSYSFKLGTSLVFLSADLKVTDPLRFCLCKSISILFSFGRTILLGIEFLLVMCLSPLQDLSIVLWIFLLLLLYQPPVLLF